MDCRAFKELLPRYLEGNLAEPQFGLMVEHEVSCPACAALAAEKMPATASEPAAAPSAWLAQALRRTVGTDCSYIANRLAAALDAAPETDIATLIDHHLASCPSCRALADVLRELPEYYAAFPRLTADRAFAREVLRRTGSRSSSRVGFMDVLRVLWRSPAVVMEGAAVCALLLTPLVGEPIASSINIMRGARQGIERQVETIDPRPAAQQELLTFGNQIASLGSAPVEAVENTWSQVRAWVQGNLEKATSINPSTSVPAAIARSWAQRALGRVGLMEPPASREESAAPESAEEEQLPPPGDEPGEEDN